MANSYELTATALKAIIDAEFITERFVAIHDRIHESVGFESTVVALSPESWQPNPRNGLERWTLILVQFYGQYNKDVDPYQYVDPLIVADYADRFEKAVATQQASAAGTEEVWYFDVAEITFPQDPTGNKTRFHAIVRARGNNPHPLTI